MSEPIFEKLGVADKQVITEGVEHLRKAYEEFIHKRQEQGHDFHYIDGLMIGHNFYKLIIYHLAEEMHLPKMGRDALMKIAIDTMIQSRNKPVTNETDPAMS